MCLHELANMCGVLMANLAPLEAEQRTKEGRAIVADMRSALERCTPLFDRLRRLYGSEGF